MQILEEYQNKLLEIYKTKDFGEHSFRTPLENLLNALKIENVKIIQEALSKDEKGVARADFKIYKHINSKDKLSYNALVGFVECKNIDVDLNKELKSRQLSRYSQLCPNILLTNYRQFILLSFDRAVKVCELFDENLNPTLFSENEKQIFLSLISDFYGENHANIKSKAELIKVLSSQSFYLSTTLKEAYDTKENKENERFFEFFKRTYESFLAIQRYGFDEFDFCDLIAQSVIYGLFVSFVENKEFAFNEDETQNFISYLPKNFKTLSELVYFSLPNFDLPEQVKQVLKNIQKTIALLDKPTMAKFLNLELEQIAIYLYEDFIKAYDELKGTQKRKEGGVFYTPKSVVKMIVSSLDELLKSKFNKTGFNDKSVKVLDFATGTGSFLAFVCEKILEQQHSLSQNESFKQATQNEAIKNKFLEDIYGFELSFVPYIVARLKLMQILKKKGYDKVNEADFQIYLNNTLDLSNQAHYELKIPLFYLDAEWKKARDVKHDKNLLVILGNPPYNAKSKNKGKEILELLKIYKENLNETNIQPLDNDYIKFIRFSQWKLLEQGSSTGLMGFIIPNSFLDGRIHRNMRESLYKSFDEIYILNLHGSSEKDAKNDENVFDIKIGVCISLFIKYKNEPSKGATIFYASTAQKGIFKRAEKYALLDDISQRGLNSIKWEELSPNEPYFWFVPKSFESEEYEDFWALAGDKALGDKRAIFGIYSSGIKTERDNIAIQLNEKVMQKIVDDFSNLSQVQLVQKYDLKDTRDWKIANAINVIKNKLGSIEKIAYRPFDFQYTFYSTKSKSFLAYPRFETMQHFLSGENLGLCFSKDCQNFFDTIFISGEITDIHYNGSQCYITPLYLYNIQGKIPNFTPEFLAYKAKHKILKDKNEEQILAFIYANLYNPKYRSKYLEYLKIGFPKVSFEVSVKEFERFEKLGSELIKLHLMQEIPQDEIDFIFLKESKKPNFKIAKYQEKERFVENKIILNEDLAISPIDAEIWNYTIGGYQVLKQWLKYRKDYVCTKEELEHLLKICKILKKTIEIQKALDEI
ncbi:DNA methyltransferase [Campylobacter upsaliensis]|uniref:site-specific DNA-methyltransferase (adenine-specific) n=1 Tax=Campylobacter upsaliensis JV21 TaxID=888826 RepID=A0A828QWI7_CAMUP|nr:type ISP restriction/modification enzyme [Campylobacter upsaliensis]EAH8308961.1 DNA methyltransferase [Campylobacter upsaliensis]EAI7279236.1 DNA methyltransferase [Campylobacter upsaliensis]EAK0458003.1 DNA methyltransferase [Campylobacter upsaliensis]EAK4279455.1 DNA methyltransferase [Campylobacter upsaliensis]EFM2940647.1 N-6 DNA methylase [Campylobacter upsaliensis]